MQDAPPAKLVASPDIEKKAKKARERLVATQHQEPPTLEHGAW
jgi:hypothetical protein